MCIIKPTKINEIMIDFKPDSMVFFSSKSVKTFIDNCSSDILNYIIEMQLFSLGTPTSKILQKYSKKRVIKPDYPEIYKLSDLVYKFAKEKINKPNVLTKAN